jgi:hypothetical protein
VLLSRGLPLGGVRALGGEGEACFLVTRGDGDRFLVGEGNAICSLLVESRCARATGDRAVGGVAVRGGGVLARRLHPGCAKSLSSCSRA